MGIFVLAVALLCVSGVFNQLQAREGILKDLDCSKFPTSMDRPNKFGCPSIYDPVCGTDDKTYENECMICQHNVDYKTNVGRKHDGSCNKDKKDMEKA